MLPKIDELPSITTLGNYDRITKGELAELVYPNTTYDLALPQQWVDWAWKHDVDPRGQCVTLYEDGYTYGRIAPLTQEMEEQLFYNSLI